MNLKLYDMADTYLDALERLPESGLDDQTIADTMEGLEGALVQKAQNVVAYCLNLEAEANAIEEAAAKLKKRADVLQARRDSLRGYLHTHMLRAGITEIKALDGTFRARIRDNPESVEVIAPEFIPEEYMRVIPEQKAPDKNLIKDAVKRGETIPGVMIHRGTRLEIKV